MKDFLDFGIKVPAGAKDNIKTICPACTPHQRKPQNRNSKDLSVNINEGIWNCHNCGWTGTLKQHEEKKYDKPVVIELPLSNRAIDWFKGRGINENTLKAFGITEKKEYMPQEEKEVNCILFPYKRRGEWVNVKYRDGKKNFKLTKGAELIIFNHDGISGQNRVIITEGEIDAMSVYEAGFYTVCSVPNGASKGNQRLEFLDNSWSAFTDAEEILIATDNDAAGHALKNELIRRLGRERCLDVQYPDDCKDFNEVLVNHGPAKVWECIRAAKKLPLEGIIRLHEFESELDSVFTVGYPSGAEVGYYDFDCLLNFSPGQLTTVTGIPNSGKSGFVDQLTILLASRHEWRWGICSFENQPVTKHASNLSACYVGKPFHKRHDRVKMSAEEYAAAKRFLNDHFFWFKMKDEDLSIDGIISRAKQLVKTHGIKGLLIDPYNYIDHKLSKHQAETSYISELLSKICMFSKDYDVHTILVAHPTKVNKDKENKDYLVPNLYMISGSSNFFNKTDNGFVVWRDRQTNKVQVHVQKVRFFYNGKIGHAEFDYDPPTGRYKPTSELSFYSELHKKADPFTAVPAANDNAYAGMPGFIKTEKFIEDDTF